MKLPVSLLAHSSLLVAKVLLHLMNILVEPIAADMTPNPLPYVETQPDGTNVTLRLKGEMTDVWEETADDTSPGFTVLRGADTWVRYARRSERNGALEQVPSCEVGKCKPEEQGLKRGIQPSKEWKAKQCAKNKLCMYKKNAKAAKTSKSSKGRGKGQARRRMGTKTNMQVSAKRSLQQTVMKNLVVPIQFSDHEGRSLPSQGALTVLFNGPCGPSQPICPTGSVADVYTESSYGSFRLESTVYDWIKVPQTELYVADGVSGSSKLWEALHHALKVIDNENPGLIDSFNEDGDSFIDGIAFLHSGYAAEFSGGDDTYGTARDYRVWSHKWEMYNGGGAVGQWRSNSGNTVVSTYHISPAKWGVSGNQIGRIGVICHETGHFLGLPDLYDGACGSGIGSYGLMANSWGFANDQYYPPPMSAWSKTELGWVTPTLLGETGTYSIAASKNSPQVYMIQQGYPTGEYLLIENRQKLGFDAMLPQGGLVIYHIDDNVETNRCTGGFPRNRFPETDGYPENGKHYKVAVLQADGRYNLEKPNRNGNRGDAGDVWHAGGVAAIGPSTDVTLGPSPNTDSYQGGNIAQTGHYIWQISESRPVMQFNFNMVASAPTPLPTPLPSGQSVPCVDDPAWETLTNNGKLRKCDYVSNNPSKRCSKIGTDGSLASQGCSESCGECDT